MLSFSAHASQPELVDRLQLKARQTHLYDTPTWRALLHSIGKTAYVKDPRFLLSRDHFSPEAEMMATLSLLYSDDSTAVCRFPARYAWLRTRLDSPALPVDACPDVVEFRARVPMDEVSLIFASENLNQPASIMGHSFLKVSGVHEGGPREISHAISFYSEFHSVNYPKVFFDSLVIGLPGRFALTPYEEKLSRYSDDEQRTVWEYALQLDESQRTLIQLHLLELKQIEFTYYFHKYNCATLINFILSLVSDHIEQHPLWATPRDVIKSAERAGLIKSRRIVTPPRWQIRSLDQQLGSAELRGIQKSVETGRLPDLATDESSDHDFLRLEAARAINQYEYRQKVIARETWLETSTSIAAAEAQRFPDKALVVNEHDDPVTSPGESQLGFWLSRDQGRNYIGATFLPVSHTITDDNRQFFGESQLLLFRTAIKLDPLDGALKLERLDLYSLESLVPRERITGGLSGRFALAVEPQYGRALDRRTAVSISGALGFTLRATSDLDFYGLLGAGTAYSRGRGYVYPSAEVGTVIREIGNMKTLASASRIYNQIDSGNDFYDFKIDQSVFLGPRFTANLSADVLHSRSNTIRTITVGLKTLF